MPVIIQATVDAVSGVDTEFIVGGPFWLIGDNFEALECAILERPGAESGYYPVTNSSGLVKVGERPNTVYVDIPAGTYRLRKSETNKAAAVSFIEVPVAGT